jgi:hypothetical protein
VLVSRGVICDEAKAGRWARGLEQVQAMAHQGGDVDWIASIDSTIDVTMLPDTLDEIRVAGATGRPRAVSARAV